MNHFIKNIKKCAYAIALAAGVVVNTSCEHKPLYILEDKPRSVRLIFDWENLRPEDNKPEGMHIAFNDQSKGDDPAHEYDVPTSTGLLTTLEPGQYIITGYSNDVPAVIVTPTDDDTELKATEPNNDIPGIYAVDQKELVENAIEGEGGEGDVQTIVAKPHPVNCIYTIKVINTDLEPNGKEWAGTLSGLTDAIMLSTGKSSPDANEVTRTYTLGKSAEANTRQSVISVLGKLSGKQNIVRIRVKRPNGITVTYKMDVTSQVDKASDFRNVQIIVDLSKCEVEQDGGDGSLNPAVDDFPDESEEIEM